MDGNEKRYESSALAIARPGHVAGDFHFGGRLPSVCLGIDYCTMIEEDSHQGRNYPGEESHH